MDERERMLSVGEAAERLGVTKRTIQRWVHDGKFPGAFRLGEDHQIDAVHFWAAVQVQH